MTEEAVVRVPEDSVEAQNHLVQVSVAQPLDGLHLPVRKRRVERNRVEQALRVLRDRLLEDSERQGAEDGVALDRRRVGLVAVAGRHFASRRPVSRIKIIYYYRGLRFKEPNQDIVMKKEEIWELLIFAVY